MTGDKGNKYYRNKWPAKTANKKYGMTFLYQFPEYPENAVVTSPDQEIYTNHIYDVDIEMNMSIPHAPEYNNLGVPGGKAGLANVMQLDDSGGNKGISIKYPNKGTAQKPDYVWQEPEVSDTDLCCSKIKTEELGRLD